MPLTICPSGEIFEILKVNNKRLEELGFTKGTKVMVINSFNDNLILSVKGIRIALDKKVANSIIVN